MLRSAYKHFSCINLVEVTSKNDSKMFKVAPVDGRLGIVLAKAKTNHISANWFVF